MGLEDRDYMRQSHPTSCTCALCFGKTSRNLTPEEYARVKRLLEGAPKARPYIKYSAVIAASVILIGTLILFALPRTPIVELKQRLLATLNEVSKALELAGP